MAKDADLWILIWEELLRVHQGGLLVEVVKAHRCKKEMQQMSLFEKFITEGNEKADEQAEEGAKLDGSYGAGESCDNRNGSGFFQHCNAQQAFTVLSGGGMERL